MSQWNHKMKEHKVLREGNIRGNIKSPAISEFCISWNFVAISIVKSKYLQVWSAPTILDTFRELSSRFSLLSASDGSIPYRKISLGRTTLPKTWAKYSYTGRSLSFWSLRAYFSSRCRIWVIFGPGFFLQVRSISLSLYRLRIPLESLVCHLRRWLQNCSAVNKCRHTTVGRCLNFCMNWTITSFGLFLSKLTKDFFEHLQKLDAKRSKEMKIHQCRFCSK